jgi:HAD superfamily hydrolase (TIGR01509 family)
MRQEPSGAPPYATILWDNDGVLVDTERLYFQATCEAFAAVGVALSRERYFDYFLMRSGGTTALASAQGLGAADIDALQRARNARYLGLLESEPITIPGVLETLALLRPHFALGIVTSSRLPHFEAIHRRTGLLELFDFAITREDYARSKPSPEPYRAAIARSGFPASRCLAIEDAPRGLVAARAAGLDCWVVPTEFTRRAAFSGATKVLDRIADVSLLLLDAKSS